MWRRRNHVLRRIQSLRLRIAGLPALRSTVDLPPGHDITERQWSVLESQLAATAARLQARLKRATTVHLPRIDNSDDARALNAALGEIEWEMSQAFNFFDTYMDVLTQRHTPELGPTLAGCDVLARDAIKRDHPALALVEAPLVYCDRGFGASILREGVTVPHAGPNPIPLIQIPFARLKEKHNLTSIFHEVGHQALACLGLVPTLPRTFRAALARSGAPDAVADLFALWAFEIGPDFWAFCLSGVAEAAALRELFALPLGQAFRIAPLDPHPSPYLRVLLSFAWCRESWGRGDWDDWEREWTTLYPLDRAPPETRRLLASCRSYLPTISRALFTTRFGTLGGRALPDLFDLAALIPAELGRIAAGADDGALNLTGLAPCAQLGAFRFVRERGRLGEAALDQIMTEWLIRLGRQRRSLH